MKDAIVLVFVVVMCALMFAAIVAITALQTGATAQAGSRWTAYHNSTAQFSTVRIRTECLGAEDSAAHLRLRVYDPASGLLVYGCRRAGY